METLVPQCLSCLSPLRNVNNEDYDEGYDGMVEPLLLYLEDDMTDYLPI